MVELAECDWTEFVFQKTGDWRLDLLTLKKDKTRILALHTVPTAVWPQTTQKKFFQTLRELKNPHFAGLVSSGLSSDYHVYHLLDWNRQGNVSAFLAGLRERKMKIPEQICQQVAKQLIGALQELMDKKIPFGVCTLTALKMSPQFEIEILLARLLWQNKVNMGHQGFPFCAPEMFFATTKTKLQHFATVVWNLGSILFHLISNHGPVAIVNYLPANKEQLRKIFFETAFWAVEDKHLTLTYELRTLLCQMLDPNPERRIRFADLLSHPWFQRSVIPQFL